jgi:hypothetical protein
MAFLFLKDPAIKLGGQDGPEPSLLKNWRKK